MLKTENLECSWCGDENSIPWDTERNGYLAVCRSCGKPVMLCHACMQDQDADKKTCGWNPTGGCLRSEKTAMPRPKILGTDGYPAYTTQEQETLDNYIRKWKNPDMNSAGITILPENDLSTDSLQVLAIKSSRLPFSNGGTMVSGYLQDHSGFIYGFIVHNGKITCSSPPSGETDCLLPLTVKPYKLSWAICTNHDGKPYGDSPEEKQNLEKLEEKIQGYLESIAYTD